MFTQRFRRATKVMLLAAALASGIFVIGTVVVAQTPASPAQAAAPPKPAPAVVPKAPSVAGLSKRATMYYQGVWGVDSLRVKYTESGEIIRFSYRIVDPEKAALLNDKSVEPFLTDAQAGVKLSVPQLEKVGKLRQSSTPIAGQSYWMAFSNSGRRVRPGHRVNVEIGHFRAEGLVVE